MNTDFLPPFLQSLTLFFNFGDIAQLSATVGTNYALIVAAEIGDKSQLVCMALAARHRAFPVLLGAVFAFALLNTLAVVFGVAIASWLPEYVVSATVALLFFVFGIHSLRAEDEEDDDEELVKKSGHSIFLQRFY